MIVRLNFTGRILIEKENVNITLHSNNEQKWFTADFNLDQYVFPKDASIFIDAKYNGITQRFNFGTIGKTTPPENTFITNLPDSTYYNFDLMVVNTTDKIGKIYGIVDNVRSIDPNAEKTKNISIFPANFIDLGDLIFRVSFDSTDDERPVIEFNKKIPNISHIAKSDLTFISCVYPSALNLVLRKYLLCYDPEDELSSDSWIRQWQKFITQTLNIKYHPTKDKDSNELNFEQESWINDCINAFCYNFQIIQKFTEYQQRNSYSNA